MNPSTLGGLIRAWRESKPITQEKLAEKLGVSQSLITDWERGKARPLADSLVALADVMGVHPRDLTALPTKASDADTEIPPAGDLPARAG